MPGVVLRNLNPKPNLNLTLNLGENVNVYRTPPRASLHVVVAETKSKALLLHPCNLLRSRECGLCGYVFEALKQDISIYIRR